MGMQRLTNPHTVNPQPELAGGFAFYGYWFSHGVPLADA